MQIDYDRLDQVSLAFADRVMLQKIQPETFILQREIYMDPDIVLGLATESME